jgi:hypothetical protein
MPPALRGIRETTATLESHSGATRGKAERGPMVIAPVVGGGPQAHPAGTGHALTTV